MLKIIHSIRPWIFVVCIAVLVASACVWYSTKVPQTLDGDEIVLLESDKVDTVENYYNAEVVGAMGYKTYLYQKLVARLSETLPIVVYKRILLWVLVFSTILASYGALRILEFTPGVSLGVALVVLMPRVAPVGEVFGVLTLSETLGRSFAVPIFWLLSAWYISRFHKEKRVEIVFLILGLLVGVHPATMIMFFVMSILVHAVLLLRKSTFWLAVRDVGYAVVAFALGASYVLYEILFRTKGVASVHESVSTQEYLSALFYRIPWEYPPESVIWFQHIVIVSAFFLVCLGYVWYRIRKGEIKKDTISYLTVLWSTWALGVVTVVHIAVPVAQLYAIKLFDAPLVLWQFGRMYKLSYLALALVFAVVLTDVKHRYGMRYVAILLVCGVFSSSFAFEWFQFVIGYQNYAKGYVPVAWQEGVVADEYAEYDDWCRDFASAGAEQGDIVLQNDFSLRYFCNLYPYTTYEEGSGHIFLGKESLVFWHKEMLTQTEVLKGEDSESLKDFAYARDAKFAVVPRDSVVVDEYFAKGENVVIHGKYAIIDLRNFSAQDRTKAESLK